MSRSRKRKAVVQAQYSAKHEPKFLILQMFYRSIKISKIFRQDKRKMKRMIRRWGKASAPKVLTFRRPTPFSYVGSSNSKDVKP